MNATISKLKKVLAFIDTSNIKIDHRNNFDVIRFITGRYSCTAPLSQPLPYLQPSKINEFLRGEMAVYCFFCISGFLITRSYLNDSCLEDYFKKRFLRIYPPIVIVFILMLLTGIIFSKDIFFLVSTSHILIFQDLLPSQNLTSLYIHRAFWTLVIEVQFYVMLPVILTFWKKFPIKTYIALFLFYWISIYLQTKSAALVNEYYVIFRQSIFVYAAYFIAGLVLAISFDKIKKFYLLFVITAICTMKFINFYFPVDLAILIVFVAVILPYLGRICFFGDISYGVYIYHFPVFFIFSELSTKSTYIHNLSTESSTAVMLSAIILVSLASYHLVEKRCIKLGKRKTNPNPNPSPNINPDITPVVPQT